MREFNYILFDFDGTLTDTGPGIRDAVNYALAHYGIHETDPDKYRHFVGPPLEESFAKYYDLPVSDPMEPVWVFREYYENDGWQNNQIYPGIPQLLHDLKQAGKTVLMATGKPEDFAIRIAKQHGIFEYFDFIGATDLSGDRHTKSQVISYVMDNMHIRPEDGMLMIGDRKYDVNGAHSFNIPCMGILYGYGSRQELENAGADFICETVADICRFLLN